MYIEFEKGQKFVKKGRNTSEDLSSFEDAGYLLKDNEMVVDIDNIDKNIIKKIIDKFNIKTKTVWTDRGAHLYFEKPQGFRNKDGFTPIGINVEYKTNKNTPNGITVKRNGVAREVENESSLEPLPYIFKRLAKANEYETFYGLSENRNNKLYAHKMKIIKNTKDYSNILYFINDYLLDEPLEQREIETIARFEETTIEKGEENRLAELIEIEYRIVKYNNSLYFFNGVHYENNEAKLIKIIYNYCENMPTKFVDEVKKQLEYKVKTIEKGQNDEFAIRFKNGVLKNGNFFEVDYKEFTPFYIDREFKKEAEEVKEVNEFLNYITNSDENFINLILEMIAYSFITKPSLKKKLAKFFILTGMGGNGKGTLIEIIKSVMEIRNCSFVSLHDFSKEQYLYSLNGKLVNFDDDMKNKGLDDNMLKIIKNIVTGDTVEIRKLYKQSEASTLTNNLICSSNHILKSFEKSTSFKRRILWLPMNNSLKKFESVDGWFDNLFRTEQAIDYWTRLTIEAYKRVYKNEKFSESEVVKEFNEQYHYENNEMYLFLEDYNVDLLLNKPVKELYDEYLEWFENNSDNEKPLSKRQLGITVDEMFNLKSNQKKIKGKNTKVYS